MIRKNLMKTLTVVMAAMMAMMTVACGATTPKEEAAVIRETAEATTLENTIMNVATKTGVASDAGKVETVYVTASASGDVQDVIVSEWLKNADASAELKDATQLQNIVNVKGSETFTEDEDGTVVWAAEGSDIYYQGTTDKELPVTMKITYTLDGEVISPEELAGKSGKVTIRFDYENKDKQTVTVDGKDVEVYTPFAMVSGMILDSDKFSNVEVSNGKVISDGGKTVVMGVAVPGLKESLDISDEKWEELDEDGKIEEKLSDHFEVTADVTDFSLGMTITMASSDILSDFGMSEITGSDKIGGLKDDMNELKDGSDKLVDGSKELKDGTGELRDGVQSLKDGSQQLADGTGSLYNGTQALAKGAGELANGATQLSGGSKELADGTAQLAGGSKDLANGTAQLASGSKTLSDGGNTLYSGLKDYLDATMQIRQGAGSLAEGAESAKAGSAQLVAGMEQADIVNNAAALAAGSSQVSVGVNELVNKLSAMKDLMAKKQEISGQYEAFSHAQAFLEGKEECSETVVQALYVLSDGKIADAATAIDIRNTGLAAMQGTLTIGGETAANTRSEQTPAATTAQNANAITDVSGNDDPAGSTVITLTQAQLNAMMAQVAAEAQQKTTEALLAQVKAQTEAKTAETTALIGKISLYSGVYGSTKASTQILGQTLETLNAVDFSEATLAQLQALKTGAEQVAAGNTQMADGIKSIHDGAKKLDVGIGALSTGAAQLSAGTGTLVSNNDKLSAGAGALVSGAKQIADGAAAVNTGADQLAAGAGQVNAGADQLAAGAGQLADGAGKLNAGAGELNDGARQLDEGANALNDGVAELNDGVITLDDGVQELLDGMLKFDEEGIQKLYEAFDGDLTEFADRVSAIQEAGKGYTTFGGSSEEEHSSVKFIIKTDSIQL